LNEILIVVKVVVLLEVCWLALVLLNTLRLLIERLIWLVKTSRNTRKHDLLQYMEFLERTSPSTPTSRTSRPPTSRMPELE
jgi:hypothetical protein